MTYSVLYSIHVIAVLLSGSFFLTRAIWMWIESPLLEARLTRLLPHVIDTCLLLAALGLMMVTSQYPSGSNWLTIKIAALLIYIALGLFALRRAPTKPLRGLLSLLAFATFLFMVSVAFTKSPLGVFSLL